MDIEGLAVDHELGKLGQVLLDLPIDLVPGESVDGRAHLGLDDHHHGLAEGVFDAVHLAGDQHRIHDPRRGAVDVVQIEFILRGKPRVVEDAGVAAGNELLPVDGDGDDGAERLGGEPAVGVRGIGGLLHHVVVDVDLLPVGPEGSDAHVVEDVDVVFVSEDAAVQIVDAAFEHGAPGLSHRQQQKQDQRRDSPFRFSAFHIVFSLNLSLSMRIPPVSPLVNGEQERFF